MFNFTLWRRLRALNKRAEPTQDFDIRLRERLGISSKKNWIPAGVYPVLRYGTGMTRYAVGFCAIVLLVGFGTAGYAYASDDVTPDHPLYGVRQAIESLEEAIANTPDWKERVVTKRLERKVREIEIVKKRGKENIDHLEKAKLRLERVLRSQKNRN